MTDAEGARPHWRRSSPPATRPTGSRATVAALREALPGAAIYVADDASTDGTAEAALAAGALVVGRRRPHGKGANVTAAAEAALSAEPPPASVLLCDGDLGASAARLWSPCSRRSTPASATSPSPPSAAALGGGFGFALGFARWAIRRLCGLETAAPISGQRAMRAEVLRATLPFARGYGMEIGMTVDAVRAGYRLREYELDLEHRATGRDLGGFLHRARQLADFARAYLARRPSRLAERRQGEFDDLGRPLRQLARAAPRRSRAGSPPRSRPRSLPGSPAGPRRPRAPPAAPKKEVKPPRMRSAWSSAAGPAIGSSKNARRAKRSSSAACSSRARSPAPTASGPGFSAAAAAATTSIVSSAIRSNPARKASRLPGKWS